MFPARLVFEKVAKMTINKIRPGQAFRIWLGNKHLDYRLIHVNECRAYVEPLHHKKLDILEDSPGGRVSVTPNCECEIIDEELENTMKHATATTATTISKKKSSRGGDRKYDPKKQTRPVRQGTIRADLLAALESGETSIPKLMKKFGMARSLLIAHVHEMWNCHGYGYSVTGDAIKIVKPVGGVLKSEPTKSSAKKQSSKKKTEPDLLDDDLSTDNDDDDFLA